MSVGAKAGRELDALVAEKVMKLQPCSDPMGRCEAAQMSPPQCWGDGGPGSDLRPYSTDISASWEVVKKMREWVSVEVEFSLFANEDGSWDAAFGIEDFGVAETAPLAICLAALRAVGEDV